MVTIAAVLVAAGLASLATWAVTSGSNVPREVVRLAIGGADMLADGTISSDGTQIVHLGPSVDRSRTQLYIRRLNELESKPLRGTQSAGSGS